MAVSTLDFSDGLQQPSAFGLSQPSQVQTVTSAPATTTTAQTTPTAGATTPVVATPAASVTTASTCGITNLSGCFSGDNFIAGALGFIFIIFGLLMFKPVQQVVGFGLGGVSGAKLVSEVQKTRASAQKSATENVSLGAFGG